MPNSYERLTPTQRNLVDKHLGMLLWLGILLRVFVALLVFLASYLPTFDSSASILLEDASKSFFKRWIATSFRWDSFHFLHITEKNYEFEHEWAFFPGVPAITGISEIILSSLFPPSIYTKLFGQYLLSIFLTPATARTLYLLTLEHTKSPEVSLLSACLSLLPSSPATLALAPYTEPWFAFLSYKGMLSCADHRWLQASGFFSLASMFRSNSIFLGGFIIWGKLVAPVLAKHQIYLSSVLSCVFLLIPLVLPIAGFQILGYRQFCTQKSSSTPSWCAGRLPMIYSHVQSHYWNVGFLRYWTLQQLPNFLLATPVLLLLLYSSLTHILRTQTFMRTSPNIPPRHPLLTTSILPHAIHAFIFTCILLFASHTQIILRLASSMPFTYWSAARLFGEHPRWARAWVAWSVVWGATSVVLWTTFLPPA